MGTESAVGNRDSVFQWPQDDQPVTGRQEVAWLLDGLRLATNARKVLKTVFDAIWPAELRQPLESVDVGMKDLQEGTKLSKGTISPQLTHLKVAGWIETEGRGNVYRVNWQQLFELDRSKPVQPVQTKLDRLDRTLDRLDRSEPEKLDRLDRLPIGPNNAVDAFSPLERLANANEELVSVVFQILDRLETLEEMKTVVEKLDRSIELLDRLDQLDRSNRSKNAPCTCMECKNVIHDMSWGTFEDSENAPAQAGTVSPPQPASQDAGPVADKPTSQETPTMDPKDFKWPDELYAPGKGLLAACFSMATGRERLWHAVRDAGVWPRDARGHIAFIGTVIYCHRTADKPGAALTAAVRGAHYGPRARYQKQDLQAANNTIGLDRPRPTALPRKRDPAAPERDWSDIDRQLQQMGHDQACALLDGNIFAAQYRREQAQDKDPRQLSGSGKPGMVLTALRRALAADVPPPPQPVAACTPGLDMAGMDL